MGGVDEKNITSCCLARWSAPLTPRMANATMLEGRSAAKSGSAKSVATAAAMHGMLEGPRTKRRVPPTLLLQLRPRDEQPLSLNHRCAPSARHAWDHARSNCALTRPIFTDFYRFFGLYWETSTFNNYHPEDSKRSGSGRIEFSSKSTTFLVQ